MTFWIDNEHTLMTQNINGNEIHVADIVDFESAKNLVHIYQAYKALINVFDWHRSASHDIRLKVLKVAYYMDHVENDTQCIHNQGWICPNCNTTYAPFVLKCECKVVQC